MTEIYLHIDARMSDYIQEQDGEHEEPAPVAVVVVVSPECAVVGAVDAVPIVVVSVMSVVQVSGRDSRRVQSV